MEQLPASLTYSASKQSLRLNRFQVRPTSSSSGGPSTTFRFNLPSKSLVDLSSFSVAFDLTISGLVDTGDANFANASLPWGHRLFSSIKVYVGGLLVSGGLSNHYDILASALAKASGGEDWVLSRLNEHALELIANRDDINSIETRPGAASKSASYIVSDFLGAFRGNGAGRSIIDTSLWGDIVIELVTSTEASIKQNRNTATTADITFNLSNVEAYVNCITQTTPLYIKLITMLLDEKEAQIRFPYQNFVTTISGSGSNARFQVNSNSIDMMVICPLSQNFNALHGTAGAANITPASELNCTRYRFDSGKTAATPAGSKGCAMQIQIGSDTFPKLPIDNGLHVSNITQDALFSNSLYSQNLLFNDVAASAVKYSREAFLNENFVWINGFCDSEGWSSKVLTGVDSASQNLDIVVNTSAIAANGSLFMAALTTSMLVFDTKSGIVSVVP